MERDFSEEIAKASKEHRRLLDAFVDQHTDGLATFADWCAESLAAHGKLLVFGNGGSAALAQELAAELVNRYQQPRKALAALALTTDGAVLSSIGNDSAFGDIFARQVEALARPEDLVVGISTSGESENVLLGLRAARKIGVKTVGLLGGDGGSIASEVDLAVVVPGSETARVQEIQLFAVHLLCRWIEHLLGLVDGS